MSVVLMYHGLYHGEDTSRIDKEDLPYAVSSSNFAKQLDALHGKSVGLVGNQSDVLPDIVITFDDGHVSNFDIAMPLLAERGLNAYFFITSDFIENRPHFCSAEQLKRMADAGAEIGSHGKTHLFFDDLSDADAECELRQSLEQLSDQCGRPVKSISYPGGRYNSRTLELSRTVGYAQLFGSGIGLVGQKDVRAAAPMNRVAIRRNTSLDEFTRIINSDPTYYSIAKSKHVVKSLVKRTLGNRLYHGLYKSISAR